MAGTVEISAAQNGMANVGYDQRVEGERSRGRGVFKDIRQISLVAYCLLTNAPFVVRLVFGIHQR